MNNQNKKFMTEDPTSREQVWKLLGFMTEDPTSRKQVKDVVILGYK